MGIQFRQITIIGTVGRNAELGYTPNGTANLKFSVATEDGTGDNKRTDWFNVTLWGQTGERMQEYITKGTKVGVSGRFKIRDYKDRDGKDRYSLDISADNVQLLSSKGESETGDEPVAAAKPKKPKTDEFAFADDETEDVPF